MENMRSGQIRKKRKSFAQVSNAALMDQNLSLKAKGLYALIESLISIPDFTLYKSTLCNYSKEGNSAFESAWKELKNAGYLVQEKIQTHEGFIYEYDLLDTPEEKNTAKESDCCSNSPTPRFSISGESTPGKPIPGNPTPGKLGGYNNTKTNNTNKNNSINNNITNNTNNVVDTHTPSIEEIFNNMQNKISLEKLRMQDAYQLEQNFYVKPDAEIKKLISKLTKADKATVYAFTEDKTWDLYWKFLLLNKYLPDYFNELPEGIKSPNAYLIGIIRNISKDSDY